MKRQFLAAVIGIGFAFVASAAVRLFSSQMGIGTKTVTLPTCAANYEGQVYIQNGGVNTGGATAMCICTSSGAASPTYQWCSIKAVVGAAMTSTCSGGSTTVCP